MKLRKHVFEFTPLGKADKEVREFLEDHLDEKQMGRYVTSLRHYRHIRALNAALKALFYASLITSFAATIGLESEARLVEQVASYLGTTLIFVLFVITGYISMIRRENYHVQREILISRASVKADLN